MKCIAQKYSHETWLVVTEGESGVVQPVDGFYFSERLAKEAARYWTRDQDGLNERLETCRVVGNSIDWA